MIIILIGPPFAGKDTQAKLLSKEVNLPVFSMGAIIREAYEKRDPRAVEGFENYSLKGKHVPIKLKFDLMRDRMESSQDGFILDNFPATSEDLEAFNNYLLEKNLKVNHVVYLTISEMDRRMIHRGRGDDNPEIVHTRRRVQDEDRKAVIEYYRNNNLLVEIDGSGSIEEVHGKIKEAIND
jgi:adenylate kinase